MSVKYRVLLILLVVVTIATAFDFVRAGRFAIDLVELSPSPGVADGETPVSLTFLLTDRAGEPVAGHSLWAISLGGGAVRPNRAVTGPDGKARMRYFPYLAAGVVELQDVPIEIMNESNSVFIEINTRATVVIPMIAGVDQGDTSHSMDAIFGE